MPPFVHLHVHGPFSRLEGASTAEALCARAAALGMEALALTDRDTLAGAVPFLQACRRHGLRAILGAEVTLAAGGRLVLLAPDAAGYAALCRLLSRAHLDHPRDRPAVEEEVLAVEAPRLIALSGGREGEIGRHLLGRRHAAALSAAAARAALFGRDRFYLELPADRLPGNDRLIRALRELGAHLGLSTLAAGDVHYAAKEQAWVADLLACVRLRCRVDEEEPPGRAAEAFNAERYLKGPAEVAAAVGDPGALARTAEVAARCEVPLELGGNRYPHFPLPGGVAPERELRRQVEEGARQRHGGAGAATVWRRLEYELSVICGLGFADYFLCVADVARWARRRGIRVAGRGSAADSAVAYVLGITDVDAAGRGHLFERFLSAERAEPPDIDLDFDARHRDRVAEYVVDRYGRQRVSAVGAHNTWCARSAVRELGKALGFPAETLGAVAGRIPYYVGARELHAALEAVPELRGLPARRHLGALAEAVAAVAGLPRHASTHLGGLCVTPGPVTDLMPVQRSAKGVVVAQFDKRDLEALGLLKLDLLSLRTLGAVDDALRLAPRAGGAVDYERIPEDDPATYARLRRGETVGVFQLESAAQMALQVRLGADRLEDVIASVALIRPGPIQGDMVEPFVRRRLGREAVDYPAPELEDILRRTYGVVVYQEQVIAIATRLAGFSPGEGDRLRRVMSHARSPAEMEGIGRLFRERAVARGVAPEVAERVFACLRGYASYGFPEAHAVAFGATAYRTAYLAEHRPAAYFAGLLDNQPMGFYPVGTLVGELRRRGVAVLGPDVNRSGPRWAQGPEAGARRLRAPLLAVRGLKAAVAEAILAGRERGGPYTSLYDLCRRVPAAPRDALESLVLAGACDGLGEGGGVDRSRAPGAGAGAGRWPAPGSGSEAARGDAGAEAGPGAGGGGVAGWAGEEGQGLGAGGRGVAGGGAVGRGVVGGGANRRALLWSLPGVREAARSGGLPLCEAAGAPLDDFSPREKWLEEERLLGFSPRGHVMELVRAEWDLDARGLLRAAAARSAPDGQAISVAGLPVRPHRPPTRSGQRLVFLALEDETGLCPVLVPEPVYLRDGAILFPAPPVLAVEGRVRCRGNGMSLTAERVEALAR